MSVPVEDLLGRLGERVTVHFIDDFVTNHYYSPTYTGTLRLGKVGPMLEDVDPVDKPYETVTSFLVAKGYAPIYYMRWVAAVELEAPSDDSAFFEEI